MMPGPMPRTCRHQARKQSGSDMASELHLKRVCPLFQAKLSTRRGGLRRLRRVSAAAAAPADFQLGGGQVEQC